MCFIDVHVVSRPVVSASGILRSVSGMGGEVV